MADPSTRVFRASLRGRLYRDIELPSSGSLEDLAAAIVDAFGFDFDDAFGFHSNLEGLEQVAAGHAEAADDVAVDALEGLGDGRVGLGQGEEGPVAQAPED